MIAWDTRSLYSIYRKMHGEQTVQFSHRLTNSSEWTLSRSPLKVERSQRIWTECFWVLRWSPTYLCHVCLLRYTSGKNSDFQDEELLLQCYCLLLLLYFLFLHYMNKWYTYMYVYWTAHLPGYIFLPKTKHSCAWKRNGKSFHSAWLVINICHAINSRPNCITLAKEQTVNCKKCRILTGKIQTLFLVTSPE